MKFYCISVLTGSEENYRALVQKKIESESDFSGKIHFLRKKMRLKKGKEYFEPFFPGYVFLETDESDFARLRHIAKEKGFLRFLPSNTEILPLGERDKSIVSTILGFGSTVGIVPVTFDEGDRIVILDGLFKNLTGRIVAVNRRNKRVNIELDFMNSARVIGLTYSEVKKEAN